MQKLFQLASAIKTTPQGSGEAGTTFGLPVDDGGLLWVLNNIANAMLGLVATAAVLFIIVGAVQYVMSAGNDESMEKAKKTIMWAIRGMIIAILAWSIVNILVVNTPLSSTYTQPPVPTTFTTP